MGMSPQTGLMHNNRVGDFDPFALPILLRKTGKSLDQILEEPLYLAAGAGALLVLGGLGFLLYRRKKTKRTHDVITTDFIDVGSTSSRIAPPVVPSPDTGDFTRLSASQVAAPPPQSEDVDPISEADLFLNFGRDVQAEAIL